jgi:flagellin
MEMPDVSLTASMRSGLLSIEDTSKLMDKTQTRLSTGKKVNSALDNATSFFAATQLKSYYDDLSSVQENILKSIQTVKAAANGISSLSTLLGNMKGVVAAAISTNDPHARSQYARTFDALYSELNAIASDSSYQGKNLIGDSDPKLLRWKADDLPVSLNPSGSSEYTIAGNFLGSGYALYQDGVPDTGWVANADGTKIAACTADTTKFPGPGPAPTPLDFVFVLDTTGSMSGYVSKVIDNAKTFVENMAAQGVDGRYAFVKYGDITTTPPDPAVTAAPVFYTDASAFSSALSAIPGSASGGGDFPESGLEAILATVSALSFRPGATKRMVLLTDATVHTTSDALSVDTIAGTAAAVSAAGIQLDIATSSGSAQSQLAPLAGATGGRIYHLDDTSFYTDNFGVTPDPAIKTEELSILSADYDNNKFTVYFPPPDGAKTMTAEKSGLGLYHSWLYDNFSSAAGLQAVSKDLDSAFKTLRTQSEVFWSGSSILTIRDAFTSQQKNVSETGADGLILADMNEEAANMLMLQVRQSLAVSSLGMASQASKSVMKLF